jgi:hypothetical protein
MHCDRGDRRSGAGACGQDRARRCAGQKRRGQGQDENQAGHDERGPAQQRAAAATDAPGAEDRQLGGGGSWQQVAGGDGVFELDRRQPAPALDAQFAQQLDVGGRPAEADAADASPLAHHHGQARPPRVTRLRIGVTHRTAAEVSSAIGLQDAWSDTVWRGCTPRENTSNPLDMTRGAVDVSGMGWLASAAV